MSTLNKAVALRKLALLSGLCFLPGQAGSKPTADRAVEKAAFAAGCFWSIQTPFDQTPGVLKTTVGYMGGTETNPTYKQVSAGKTDHRESIEVTFDPAQVSYEKILDVFWHNIDPTTADRQFPDRGRQYRTAIFYQDAAQQRAALASKKRLEESGRFGAPIVTDILPASPFWPAEEYHQKYAVKNPESYHQYRDHSGRDEYFQRIWGR